MREFRLFLVSVEYFVDDLRRPGDHGSITSDADRPIHDFRMFQEQTHQRVGCVIILDVQAEVPERFRVDQLLGLSPGKSSRNCLSSCSPAGFCKYSMTSNSTLRSRRMSSAPLDLPQLGLW